MELKMENVPNYGHPQKAAYKWFFYSNALRGVLRRHRVAYSHPRIGKDRRFYYYPKSKECWDRLFQVPDEMNVPFTVYSHSAAVGLMKVISGLGVNFRYLLHLKNEIWFYDTVQPGQTYEIDYKFEEVVRIKPDKAAIVGYSAIRKGDKVYREVRDHFVIKEVPPKYADRLRWDESNQFKGITRIPVEPLVDSSVKEIYIPGKLPIKYAGTSGDYNIVHISPLTARMFGYRRPFIQGLCTANLIISELFKAGKELSYFSITFSRPVLTRSTVYLHFTDKEYRLQDDNHTLCFGRFETK